MPEFNSYSTADQVLAGRDLSDYTAIVTGGNSGIGVETVSSLAKAGARVILTSRSLDNGEKVAKEINSSEQCMGKVEAQQLDLTDLDSVKACSTALLELKNIDFLILNAGVMGSQKQYTKTGFELQMGTNNHGHFYLIKLLAEKLKTQERPCRIIVVSSEGHRMGSLVLDDLHYKNGRRYNRWLAYGQSKLGNILLAKELNVRFAGSQVTAFSLHPGSIIDTGLLRYNTWIFSLGFIVRLFCKNVQQGAATSVFAAVDEDLLNHPGVYLSNCKIVSPTKQAEDMEMAKAFYDKLDEEIKTALHSTQAL